MVRRSPAEVALRRGHQWWPLGWSRGRPTGHQPADGTGQDFLFGRFAAAGVACSNRIAKGVPVLAAGDDATRVVSFAAFALSTRGITLRGCRGGPSNAQGSCCTPARPALSTRRDHVACPHGPPHQRAGIIMCAGMVCPGAGPIRRDDSALSAGRWGPRRPCRRTSDSRRPCPR